MSTKTSMISENKYLNETWVFRMWCHNIPRKYGDTNAVRVNIKKKRERERGQGIAHKPIQQATKWMSDKGIRVENASIIISKDSVQISIEIKRIEWRCSHFDFDCELNWFGWYLSSIFERWLFYVVCLLSFDSCVIRATRNAHRFFCCVWNVNTA